MTEKLRRKPKPKRRTKDDPALCQDCRADTGWDGLREWYVVEDSVWDTAWPGTSKQVMRFGEHRHILCLGCLEARLGRQLHSGDFTPAPINDPTNPRISARMRARLRAMALPDGPASAGPRACARGLSR